MPEYGRLTPDAVPHTSPIPAPLYPPPPWPLPESRVLKIVFETSADAVLTWLPPKLSRSAPPYAIVTVASYRQSPVGPFNVATQYVGCRAGFFTRAFALQMIADNSAAVAALREIWGLPCQLGSIEVDRSGSTVHARLAVNDGPIASMQLNDGTPIDPGAVRIDPVLTVRATPAIEEGKAHDLLQLVQIDPDYELSDCLRGRGSLTYPNDESPNPWAQVPMLNMISAVDCSVSTELPLARYVMPY